MFDCFKRMLPVVMAAATGLAATQVFAQAPTDAQRDAIKSSCRSDYMAKCASVPPGGAAALQCLQKNLASLSSSCQAAVKAVAPAADAKPAAAPVAVESKPETAKPAAMVAPATGALKPVAAEKPASAATPKPVPPIAAAPADKPSDAQVAAIRGACRTDYPNLCATVPTGGAAALQCLENNKAKLSAACEKAVAAVSGGAATEAAPAAGGTGSAAASAAPSEPLLVLRPMRPIEEFRVLNAACGPDAKALCGAVQAGGGRIVRCLAANARSLSPDCKGMLAQFAAQ